MNEVEFRNWLVSSGVHSKVISDIISRIKRIEREIGNCDIDEQYRSDKCERLLLIFSKMGTNAEMKKEGQVDLPIGKYYMNTYRHAIKQYILFKETSNLL